MAGNARLSQNDSSPDAMMMMMVAATALLRGLVGVERA